MQSFKVVEADSNFKRFVGPRNQPIFATENVTKKQNMSPFELQREPKDKDEQLKIAHKTIKVVDRSNRMTRVNPLQFNLLMLERKYHEVLIFA